MAKDMLPHLKDMASYDDVLWHVANCHGEEGRRVASDPNSPAMIWHELAHVDPDMAETWDHGHYGTDERSVTDMMRFVNSLLRDPDLDNVLSDILKDNPEMFSDAEQTRREIAERRRAAGEI